MRRHPVILTIIMIVGLMILTTMSALAEGCTLCGGETSGDSYLCTSCLVELLTSDEPASTVTIDAATNNGDGTVTLSWTDSGEGAPYTVYYELLESAPRTFGWTAATGLTDTSLTLTRLVPGVDYSFTVVDKDGRAAEIVYYAPDPGEDTEIGTRIRVKPRSKHIRVYKTLDHFAAWKIAADNDYEYGMTVRVNYSMLKKTRHYNFQVVMEAPNGFKDTVYSGTLTLSHGRSYLPLWGFVSVDDYFDLLNTYYGEIPAGDYTVALYLNGALACTDSITVSE
ncbi:MAG: fibronectin type III domain-containing protein [Clostridia bacterium]|nr:fibronectin type III domain-containing protein [Clostridia bacterium]